jgi:hypothetical protein
MTCRSTMTKLTHGLADFPFGLFIFLRLAAIPFLFALGKCDFALGDAFAKVNPQGNDRQTLVVHFSFQLVNLFLPEKQLPRSEWSMVKWTARKIFANMEIHEPDFAAANYTVGVPQVGPALPERFNLGAKQHHARFQLLKKDVIVRGGAVLGYDQLSGFFLFFGRFSHRLVY